MGQFPGPVNGSWKGRPKAQGLRTPRKRRSCPGGNQRLELDPVAVAGVAIVAVAPVVAAAVAVVAAVAAVAVVAVAAGARLAPWEARNECGATRRNGSSWQAARLTPSTAA